MSITKINNLGITDGTIVNADISASAAIASTKLSGVNDAKAWVNFNGTGTPAIRASFNVTSITDNGTGDYTVNFTNAFANANYCGTAICGFGTDSNSPNMHMAEISRDAAPTTTTFRIDTMSAGVTQRDIEFINLAFFR